MNFAGSGVHSINNCQRFNPDTHLSEFLAAFLESLFNRNANTFQCSACLFEDFDQSEDCAAIGEEIIDNQNVVVRTDKFLGYDNVVDLFMGKGFNFCRIDIAVQIDALRLFGKDNRNAEMLSGNTCNSDAGGFDGQDFVDRTVSEQSGLFFSEGIKQIGIHLVIEKTVNFQNVSFFDNAIPGNSFFQQFHSIIPFGINFDGLYILDIGDIWTGKADRASE